MQHVDTLILISIGNSRTRVAVARGLGGRFDAKSLEPSRVVENDAPGELEDAIAQAAAGQTPQRALVASVNDGLLGRVVAALDVAGAIPLTRFTAGDGRKTAEVRIPIVVDLTGPMTVGVDRLLNAVAAYSRSGGQACVVIDAGTAVTVDFIDRHGVFQGGVIAPGVAMMLKAMHTGTSALPAVSAPRSREGVPAGPMGKNTVEAMTLGALNAVRGLAHVQIDAYAEAAGRYPRVIATGGDAPILFENDGLVEHIVPDLPLVGMLTAWGIISGTAEPAPAAVEEGEGEDEDGDLDEE